ALGQRTEGISDLGDAAGGVELSEVPQVNVVVVDCVVDRFEFVEAGRQRRMMSDEAMVLDSFTQGGTIDRVEHDRTLMFVGEDDPIGISEDEQFGEAEYCEIRG